MLNIHELERRWLTYKIKSYLPKAAATGFLLALTVSLFIYLPLKNNALNKIETASVNQELAVQPEPLLATPKQAIPSGEKEIAVPENTQELPLKIAEASLLLKPSLHFMDKIEEDVSTYIESAYTGANPNTASATVANNTLPASFKPQEEERAISEPEEIVFKEEKTMLTITKQEDESDLKDIIRRFKANKNPALSLFIAKRYYNAGQYQKSYNYALMTNEIDQNIDESWIIFSKSLVKLGQHELAINTLKAYLKTSKSTAAEVLLRNIETGDFR